MSAHPAQLVGLFVGGRARRMGGASKALLPAPNTGEPLAARLIRIAQQLGLEVVLVGQVEDAALPPSAAMLPRLPDEPKDVGPLGGLAALLAYAGAREALVLACDMPYVSAALLERLANAPRTGSVIAPRDHETGKWQPLFARYDAAAVRPVLAETLAAGDRSFQALFARCDCTELLLSAVEHAELRDWDVPADVER